MNTAFDEPKTSSDDSDEGTYPIIIGDWRDDSAQGAKPGISYRRTDREVPLQLPPNDHFENLFTNGEYFAEQMRTAGWPEEEIFDEGFAHEAANRALVADLHGVAPSEDEATYEVRREAVGKVLYGKEDLNEEEFFAATGEHYRRLQAERGLPPAWVQPEDEKEFPEIVERARLIELGRAYAEDAARRLKRPMAKLDEDSLEHVGRQVLQMQRQANAKEPEHEATVLSRIADGVKLVSGGMTDGTLAFGEGFYNQYAQILRHSLPDSDWARTTANEAERLSNEFDQLRAAYANVYKVDEKFANSFTGQLLTGAGRLVPQTVVVLLPGVGVVSRMAPVVAAVGIAALQSQNFQDAWEDAERVAAERGRPFDPNRAFAYAETVAFTSMLLDRFQVNKAVRPWLQSGGGRKIREGAMKIFRSAFTGGLTTTTQGAVADGAATALGIEERNVFDIEKRTKQFAVGAVTTAALSTTSGAASLLADEAGNIDLRKIKMLGRKMTVPVVRGVSTFKNLSEARRWLKTKWAGKPIAAPALDGDMVLSRSTAEKMTSASAVNKSTSVQAHLAAIESIPELAKNAVVESHPDRGNDPHIIAIHRLYTPMEFDGKLHRVKMTVKQIANKQDAQHLYSLEAVEIEVPAWSPAEAGLERAGDSKGSAPTPHAGFIKVDDLLPKSTSASKKIQHPLGELFPEVTPDAMVHFSIAENQTSIQDKGIVPNKQGYSHWFRFDDIRNLSSDQIPALIGNLAHDNVQMMHVANPQISRDSFKHFGNTPGTSPAIPEFEATIAIPVEMKLLPTKKP